MQEIGKGHSDLPQYLWHLTKRRALAFVFLTLACFTEEALLLAIRWLYLSFPTSPSSHKFIISRLFNDQVCMA